MADNSFYARYSNSFYDTLADKIKKQKYLIDNIINQGYDKEIFAEYMIAQRDNGADIDNWSYDELVSMVKMFKRQHTSNMIGSEMYDDGFMPNSNSDEEDKYNEEEEADRRFKLDDDSPNIESPRLTNDFQTNRTIDVKKKLDNNHEEEDMDVGNEDSPDIPNEISPGMKRNASSKSSQRDYEVIGDHMVRDTIVMKNKPSEPDKGNQSVRAHNKYAFDAPKFSKTDKGFSEISQLKKKNLSVIVHKHAISKDGFFSFSYPSYEINLNPIGWRVRRKEQDFIYLRQYLRTRYPQHFVPPLVLTNDRMSEPNLRKKEKYFTRFLINVLRNQDLRGSYYLQEFLSTESQEAFEKLTEQRKVERMPQKLTEYTTLHGKANVKSQTKTWQFCYKIPKFASEYEDLNHKIASTSKVLVNQFKALRVTMQDLSSYFQDLGNLYVDTDENMCDINKTISTLLSSWSDSYENQGSILKNWFPRFFKYNMNEYKSMLEVLEHRNITKDRFVKMQTELETLKTKLYAERDIEKWALSNDDKRIIDELDQDEYLAKSRMLPGETSLLNDQKLLLNYLNNTLEGEIRRVMKYNYKDLKGHFLRIADQQCQILTNTQIVWSDFIAHYVDEKVASSDEEYISCFDPIKRMKTS